LIIIDINTSNILKYHAILNHIDNVIMCDYTSYYLIKKKRCFI